MIIHVLRKDSYQTQWPVTLLSETSDKLTFNSPRAFTSFLDIMENCISYLIIDDFVTFSLTVHEFMPPGR